MAFIGIFKATDNGYEGMLETLTLKAKLTIEPAKKSNDNQPDYRVFQIAEGPPHQLPYRECARDCRESLGMRHTFRTL